MESFKSLVKGETSWGNVLEYTCYVILGIMSIRCTEGKTICQPVHGTRAMSNMPQTNIMATLMDCPHHIHRKPICHNPTLAKCEDETHTPKVGDLESSGTPRLLEFDSRGQNTSHWSFLSVIEVQMSKMASHWSFGHLQPKLWAKEGPGVKLAV
jgi:hypothetical protein